MESLSDVLIVLIVFGAIFGSGILKIVLNHKEKIKKFEASSSQEEWEQQRGQLIKEVNSLTDRVIVLERIVTDKKYDLKHEIESL